MKFNWQKSNSLKYSKNDKWQEIVRNKHPTNNQPLTEPCIYNPSTAREGEVGYNN